MGQSLNDAIYKVATFTLVTIVRTLVPDEVALYLRVEYLSRYPNESIFDHYRQYIRLGDEFTLHIMININTSWEFVCQFSGRGGGGGYCTVKYFATKLKSKVAVERKLGVLVS